ncbi:MAG: hypothetical protein ACO1N0_13125 [Fluviicola sp.]
MKSTNTINRLAYFAAFFLLLTGCSENKEKTQKEESNELTLIVSAVSQLPVGYGIRYNCAVKSVEKGELAHKNIGLMLIHSKYYEVMDKKGMSPGTCTFTFKRSGKNKDDNYPTVNGFIAKDRTVWEVVEMGN